MWRYTGMLPHYKCYVVAVVTHTSDDGYGCYIFKPLAMRKWVFSDEGAEFDMLRVECAIAMIILVSINVEGIRLLDTG